MKDLKIYRNINLNGNRVHNLNVDTPTKDDNPTTKKYVDSLTKVDTEISKELVSSQVDVGGVKKGDEIHNKTFTEIATNLFFPVVPPIYTESSIKINTEPVNMFLGIKDQHQVSIDVELGDRKYIDGNISCILVDANGNSTTKTIDPGVEVTNILCSFDTKELDPLTEAKLIIQVPVSAADPKYDNFGQQSIPIEFLQTVNITKEVLYKGVLPVFYEIVGINDTPSVDVLGDTLPWSTINTVFTSINALSNYREGVGTRSISLQTVTSAPKKYIFFIPEDIISIMINDINMLEFSKYKVHEFILPNTKGDYKQKYVGVEFVTGDAAFNKVHQIIITWNTLNGVNINNNIDINNPNITNINGHIIIDDNGIQYPSMSKLLISNSTVINDSQNSTTKITPLFKEVDLDGGII